MAADVVDFAFNFFAILDPYPMGLLFGLNQLIFLFVFAYSNLRGREEKPIQMAAEIAIYSEVVALAVAFAGVPSILAGIIIVIAYSLISKHICKTSGRVWIENFVSLWIALFIFALVGPYLNTLFTIFAIAFFFLLSEMRVRDQQNKAEAAKSKEKKK